MAPIDLIARALALKGPRGVKVIDTGFKSAGASLAGYLFFPNTLELKHNLLDSDVAQGLLEDWMKARKAGFSVEKNESATWRKEAIFDLILNPNPETEKIITMKLPLLASISGEPRGYLSWVATTAAVIRAAPDRFDNLDNPEAVKYIGGYSAQDWNRPYCVLKARWRLTA